VDFALFFILFHFKSLGRPPLFMMDTAKKNAGKKNAGKGKAGISRKTTKVPRKKSAALASANAAGVAANDGGGQFGHHGAHRNIGKVRPKSPPGANMSLSRRLSRKIILGSPLRSPM